MKHDLIVAGVGGQGSMTAAHILASAAVLAGENAKVGETYGAAMRGGSVLSHVRIGQVESPLVSRGCAETILGLEPLEGLRAAMVYMRKGALVVLNPRPWYPVDASLSRLRYPSMDSIRIRIEQASGDLRVIDCAAVAEKAGSSRTANVVMLGALCAFKGMPVPEACVVDAIRELVPAKTVDVNLKAFDLGRTAASKEARRG